MRAGWTRRSVIASGAAAAALAACDLAFGEEPAPEPAEPEREAPARMPTAFVGHGSPMVALDAERGAELTAWTKALARPVAVLCVSAHFERSPITIGATKLRALVYDFRGFPDALYRIRYDAPGAPKLARRVEQELAPLGTVKRDERRGHDHGTWVPLRWMYPEADVPLLSVSLPGHDPKALWKIGRALRPLRDEGVLLLGSGMLTHNLRHRSRRPEPPSWSSEFDAWAKETLETDDVDALLDWERKAPAARTNHPTVEHFVPLILAAGARRDGDALTFPVTGFSGGMSRRCVMLDSAG